ncbi:hypothetical protein GALMADRAFT_1090191 [Galerina marginata CBS 339.88]|uniref:Uncharacterized protein n=1 Tax=Galerina marginata (strain CBS 339.88) TaxID=685588 RepID=A0A067TDX7_GALM3|nr:hypothetical protein GALMADRAFT_1090191 [Galerina marginata CBS 339.88]
MVTPTNMNYRPHGNDDEIAGNLPTELLEKILTEAWLSAMSPIERTTFIESVSRASKTWLATLAIIATRDIYVSTPFLDRDRRAIEDQSHFHWQSAPEISPFQFCRSFTRQIPISQTYNVPHSYLSRRERLRRKAYRELLSIFHVLPCMPSLSTLSIEYLKDIKQPGTGSFLSFHLRVVRLEVEYTFSSDMPTWLVDELGLSGKAKRPMNKSVPWELPDLHHVSTSTTDPTSSGDVLKLCPHLELAEETFRMEMKVLSVSHKIRKHSAIVHGPLSLPTLRYKELSKGKQGTGVINIVRGSALGLVLFAGNGCRKSHWQDLTDNLRNVYVFKERAAW